MRGSENQSGVLITGTKNQRQISKTKYKTKSATNFKHKCAPVCRIHVGFGINQQLTRFSETTVCSFHQRGPIATRTENQKQISKTQYPGNTKQNQQQIFNINAHRFPFTSALASISS